MLIQIYEVQDLPEAEALLEIGVDHIGSVILSPDFSMKDSLLETIGLVKSCGGKSSLIPLFHDVDQISRALDHYRPDIVHFCEALTGAETPMAVFERQCVIRERFPEIGIMRSVPIVQKGAPAGVGSLEIARMFEPVSDFFLTDTLIVSGSHATEGAQPVNGFVGITGKTCDWEVAKLLVAQSAIPVILAGGISPENVQEGILAVSPAGVDSCTLTNRVDKNGAPVRFRKDIEKVKTLVAAVHRIEN